jgi:hypothetical protein
MLTAEQGAAMHSEIALAMQQLTDGQTALATYHLRRLQELVDDVTPDVEPVPAGPKFPDVTVQLSGEDGNAFFIAARVRKALEQKGHWEGATEFFKEALSGDYDHLLQTAMKYVDVR